MAEEVGEERPEDEDSLEASPETEEAEAGEEKEESVEPPEDSDEDAEEILSLEEEAEEAEPQVEAGEEDSSRGFLGGLRKRLSKTRERLVGRLDRLILGKKQIDDDLLDELEEILITADLGVRTTQELISSVTEKVRRKELNQPDKLKEYLREEIKNYFKDLPVDIDYSKAKPFVTLFIG
ncbi:MAG TPA: signal recognition particle-docking protein FtsY, partial [Deltaproteobacteria bacterium]|nr:signal recognition particle-docking protein FtsY [Deltaproteobacteria bacterium]